MIMALLSLKWFQSIKTNKGERGRGNCESVEGNDKIRFSCPSFSSFSVQWCCAVVCCWFVWLSWRHWRRTAVSPTPTRSIAIFMTSRAAKTEAAVGSRPENTGATRRCDAQAQLPEFFDFFFFFFFRSFSSDLPPDSRSTIPWCFRYEHVTACTCALVTVRAACGKPSFFFFFFFNVSFLVADRQVFRLATRLYLEATTQTSHLSLNPSSI